MWSCRPGGSEGPKWSTHSSGGWAVQDQGTCRFGVWCGPAPSSSTVSSCRVLTWQRAGQLSRVCFKGTLIPVVRAPPHDLIILQCALPNTITLGLGFHIHDHPTDHADALVSCPGVQYWPEPVPQLLSGSCSQFTAVPPHPGPSNTT